MAKTHDEYDIRWSPFSPEWYQQAFDKFINTADMLFNQNAIIEEGYYIPDADGSRSSVFRNEAVLNNSFNEEKLRETLKDIYLNSSHKLVASNHDNTHFFQWHGNMQDMSIIPNTNYCEFKIPTETFISPNERDMYKMSQFYRKWVTVTDILNNWNVFKWHCMLFIDQKVYDEYELRMDDHETTIRFRYYDFWMKQNYPVYIYKFDTSASCRIYISKELCENQWKWKMPSNYVKDPRVLSAPNWMIAINKISDPNIRKDGETHVEVLGDNLEFVKNENGVVDLSEISDFNKNYILSERSEYLYMTIVVPKFFHEYPILLPTDSIYRPYEANFQPVVTVNYDMIQNVKTNLQDNEQRQLYVDLNGELKKIHDGWKTMIRPIVLTDAFDPNYTEPYERLIDDTNHLRDLTVKGADTIEKFRFYVQDMINRSINMDDEFTNYCKTLRDDMNNIRECMHAFLDNLLIEYDQEYELLYKRFLTTMDEIEVEGVSHELFTYMVQHLREEMDFWFFISPLIYIPRELADKYYVINVIHDMGDKKIVWADMKKYLGTVRFQRPIDVEDFWTFEYDIDKHVWRPYPLELTRHFPDVYVPKDPKEEKPTLNRVFKAFFFYSDTMNIVEESTEITRPTATWNEDVAEYHFDQAGIYRDIFMEKFYWMGMRAIYKGVLVSNNRWEVIEYTIDNESYERFNKLFLKTMDPYFKLGLATYLRSSNYEFPFDDAIAKMEESIDNTLLGYKRVTNFEQYLNKTWIPSYFDYIIKIMDEWDYESRLLKRPRTTFDITRLLPILLSVQEDVYNAMYKLVDLINWITDRLNEEDYDLNVQAILDLKTFINEMYENVSSVLKDTQNLDLDIYSIDDINSIIDRLKIHMEYTTKIKEQFAAIYDDVNTHNIHDKKRADLDVINNHFSNYPECIKRVADIVNDFDMDGFMKAANDLDTYLVYNKENENDNSLLGDVNQFDASWSEWVKDHRNRLFTSTTELYGFYDPEKLYEDDEVIKFMEIVARVTKDMYALNDVIQNYYRDFNVKENLDLTARLDNALSRLLEFNTKMANYMEARNLLVAEYNAIIDVIDDMREYITPSETEVADKLQTLLHEVIRQLSYIAGTNHREEAYKSYNECQILVTKWFSLNDVEKEVFDRLFELANPPIEMIEILDKHHDIIINMMDYMDTVNLDFVSDSEWPTYSDIYRAIEIEMVTPGFEHQVGDIVYAPNLGVYKITSITGNGSQAELIEDMNLRNTTFRNPMVQFRPYDTITNGAGMGITIKPTRVDHIRIINDSAAEHTIMRVESANNMVEKYISTPNPHSNSDLQYAIEEISSIKESWDHIYEVFNDYMTSDMTSYVNDIVSDLIELSTPCADFLTLRATIKLSEFIRIFEEYIFDSYNYMEKNDLQTEQFFYYDDMIRTAFNDIYNFYGVGATWSDSNQLKNILENNARAVRIYWTHVFEEMQEDNEIRSIKEKRDNLIDMCNTFTETLNTIPYRQLDIRPMINALKTKLTKVPEQQIDIWYQFKNAAVTIEGREYKVGDIVRVIPEVDDDTLMQDVILNDSILLQITEVDQGRVVRVQPYMNYALPYKIWGIRETETLVGDGYGLTIDCFSYEMQLVDSTLLNDSKSDVSQLPPCDENDMLMFKFDNIHDLNITYEVFIGGKQISNFIVRHTKLDDDQHHQKNVDILYINANDVVGLKNSSIYIPAENYFVYKIEGIEIVDPGAGYCKGQDIVLDSTNIALKLKVAELIFGPYKGIQSAILNDSALLYDGIDPATPQGKVVTDSLNNIDDEYNVGYYDKLTQEGILKPITQSLDPFEYPFISKRFDKLPKDDRNETFMYPDVDMPTRENTATNGDPDHHWYQGSRIDNSMVPMEDERVWNGIMNVVPPTDPFIPDKLRTPTGQPVKGEYQYIARERIHDSRSLETLENLSDGADPTVKFDFNVDSLRNTAMILGDLEVETYADLPKHVEDYPDGCIGKVIIVKNDETNSGHRMAYKIRTFIAAGFFIYDIPEVADNKWNTIRINWMDSDWYADYPTSKAQYPEAPWGTAETYAKVMHPIMDGLVESTFVPKQTNNSTYIANLTTDDISVFNWSTKEWEDLSDETRWKLDVVNDDRNQKWGFTLTFLKEGTYSYDMRLYLNKTPNTQKKNAELKEDALIRIMSVIHHEVNKPAIKTSVNTGRHLRIRKLFPYEQKESYTLGVAEDGYDLGHTMNFKLVPYMHYKNEIHLEDIKVFNKTANRFENVLDTKKFEVRFKNDRATVRGFETQTIIVQSLIGNAGQGFSDGEVWAWNAEYRVHVFGRVTADFQGDGHLLTFEPVHCTNPPKDDISLEFEVYQYATQSDVQKAVVVIEFLTKKVELFGDGYIYNVTNRLAPVPDEFQVLVKYNFEGSMDYDLIINKNPNHWIFIEPEWKMAPTFHIDDVNVQGDRLYLLTDKGRFPLVNPSTGKPTLHVTEVGTGTNVQFLNLYRRYQHFNVYAVPYPMRSVYVQRHIPQHGFIDLTGKINKPLNKKYFEFWVNGKLLFDEVTIISPTKIFLHGLTSLKNLEIIEINRDSNEYFSDDFIGVKESDLSRTTQYWDYTTYLDDALAGNLEGDNYSEEEQAYLLTPVWPQVDESHPEYKNYPPNVDNDPDILLIDIGENDKFTNNLERPVFQYLIIDPPTLEGKPIFEHKLNFEMFGLRPISDEMIIDMLNEEWEEEIKKDPHVPQHYIMSDDEWYGMATRLYDENGILVHTLNESAYHVSDPNLLRISAANKISRIVRNPVTYDLT